MKTKTLWWIVVSVLAAVIVAGAVWWLGRPQTITLNDGTKLTLLGVDYGKHHKFPTVKTTERRVEGGPTSFDTTNDTLVVWILSEHKSGQWPSYQVLAYDRAATACVANWPRNSQRIRQGMEVAGVRLDAFQRRNRKIYLRITSWGQRGQQVAKGQMVISNPTRGWFPKWFPDLLPNTQSDGDLDVTLKKLVANAPLPYGRNGISKNDPANKCVQINFDVQQKGQSVTNWRPVQVETTDATGNYIKGWINDYRQNGEKAGYFYQPGLWPDEPAWKVRLEFSRTSGFNDNELWSVISVPVRMGSQQDVWNFWGNQMNSGRTNVAFAETTINGIHVKLFPAIQFTDQNRNNTKVVSVIFKTDPDAESAGMRMTPLAVTDDQGHTLNNQGASWGGGNFQYEFAEPRDIQSVNITLALHKSRFVEFTVKPAKP
jgi:hypothetical protein